MTQVLVTGGTGFVGYNLATLLAEKGVRVSCLVRPETDPAPLSRIARIVPGNLLDRDSLASAVADADIVFHLAGCTKARNARGYQLHNAEGTANLVETLRRKASGRQRIVFLSSLAASGPCAEPPGRSESDPAAPISMYGRSKLEAEKAVLSESANRHVVVVRAPILYGPGDRELLNYLKLVRWGIVGVPGLVDMPFSILCVHDLSAFLCAVAEDPRAAGRVWHVGDGKVHTWSSLGRTAAALLKVPARIVRLPLAMLHCLCLVNARFDRLRSTASYLNADKWNEVCASGWLIDASCAENELGFTPRIPIGQGLADTLQWYLQRRLL